VAKKLLHTLVNYFLVKEAFIIKQKKLLNTLVNDFPFSCFSFLFLKKGKKIYY
jgi:hypothetical protein